MGRIRPRVGLAAVFALLTFECTRVAAQGVSYYGQWFEGGYFRYSKTSDLYISMSDTGKAGWDSVSIHAAGYNGQIRAVSFITLFGCSMADGALGLGRLRWCTFHALGGLESPSYGTCW